MAATRPRSCGPPDGESADRLSVGLSGNGAQQRYRPRPGLPGYWLYGDRPILASVHAHRYVVAYAARHYPQRTPVLDVATGHGALAAALLDAGYEVSCTSWDTNADLPVPTYRLDLDREFAPADVGRVHYPLVACVDVIEHVENPSGFLRSCRAVVADDGRVILTTPNVESAPARLQWLFRGYPVQFGRGEVRNNRHISMMSREGLDAISEAAGFTVLERAFVDEPAMPGVRGMAKRLLLWLMARCLTGDLTGTTRIHVLAPSADPSLDLGPGQVY